MRASLCAARLSPTTGALSAPPWSTPSAQADPWTRLCARSRRCRPARTRRAGGSPGRTRCRLGQRDPQVQYEESGFTAFTDEEDQTAFQLGLLCPCFCAVLCGVQLACLAYHDA